MVAMSTVGAVSLLLFPPLVSIWPQAAILLRCLLGLVQGPHYPSLGSLSSQLVPAPRRPLFFSTALLGSPLGTILVGLVGSVLLEGLGWRAVVTLTGLLYASSALWLYVLTRGQGVPARAAAGASAAVPWRGLLSSGRVWACILAHMSHTTARFLLISWLPACILAHMSHTTAWFLLISWLPSYFQRVHPQAEPSERGWVS
ncbi:solute carrier family 17 member 9-like [Pollicipes pollicipes]|uniref:solute carrier family 17 member 9-like n=1 Tax=Pollicipes pollicipes TaxID=41117 RepID=UPI00188528C3|nr:solute carrier family 17 member 9-like [Pollicipes pollicipes]